MVRSIFSYTICRPLPMFLGSILLIYALLWELNDLHGLISDLIGYSYFHLS